MDLSVKTDLKLSDLGSCYNDQEDSDESDLFDAEDVVLCRDAAADRDFVPAQH